MFAWKNTAWTSSNTHTNNADAVLPELDARTTGLVAGTKVATNAGWTGVEHIQVGQQVLTFDGGLQTVIAVTGHVLMANTADVASYPMSVPAGALGNHDAMTILPHQPILIESDLAEEMTGDPFTLIPAAALKAVRGIIPMRPTKCVEIIQLHFAQDEIVFANIGALFLCRALPDLVSDMGRAEYDVLPLALAKDFTDCFSNDNGTGTYKCGHTVSAAI